MGVDESGGQGAANEVNDPGVRSGKPMNRLVRPDLQDQFVLDSHGLISAGFSC